MGEQGTLDYGLPHERWRPEQYETVEKTLDMGEGETLVLASPVGSGKTCVARAVGSRQTVTALCKTKVLQVENYAGIYGFDALFGRSNYPCALNAEVTAAECEYIEEGMPKCPDARLCGYLMQREKVKGSPLRSLNYAYWMLARWPRQYMTEYLFCDEAHLLSDVVLDFVGATVTEKQRRDWGLPPFPVIRSRVNAVLVRANPTDDALVWLRAARMKMLKHHRRLNRQKKDNKAIVKKLRQCERLGQKLRASIDALRKNDRDWYVLSGPAARFVRGRPQPGFVCRPLTARYHAPRFFLDGHKAVMMSATIGDPKTFAREVGIAEYEARTVPSAWRPEVRPVVVPKGAPRIGRAAKREGPGAYDLQADLISSLIRKAPWEWCGVIHHTSIAEAKALAGRLAARGLEDRLWTPPVGVGTEAQMAAWEIQKRRAPNSLAVTWSWHVGVDLLEERICVVAKTPFPFLGDPYERERLGYDGKFYLQRTAWALEQACGRTRRGRPQDYDTGGERRGLVAVIDNNWRRIQKYLSPSFLESIEEV